MPVTPLKAAPAASVFSPNTLVMAFKLPHPLLLIPLHSSSLNPHTGDTHNSPTHLIIMHIKLVLYILNLIYLPMENTAFFTKPIIISPSLYCLLSIEPLNLEIPLNCSLVQQAPPASSSLFSLTLGRAPPPEKPTPVSHRPSPASTSSSSPITPPRSSDRQAPTPPFIPHSFSPRRHESPIPMSSNPQSLPLRQTLRSVDNLCHAPTKPENPSCSLAHAPPSCTAFITPLAAAQLAATAAHASSPRTTAAIPADHHGRRPSFPICQRRRLMPLLHLGIADLSPLPPPSDHRPEFPLP